MTSTLNVQSISLSWFLLLTRLNVVKCLLDVSFLERTPGEMLVNFEVALVSDNGSLIFSHGLIVIFLLFV